MNEKMLVSYYDIKPDIKILTIKGLIDTTTTDEIKRALNSILRKDCYKIIVDLANAEYISSSGWNIFLSKIEKIRANGGDIKLACMQSDVFEVYELLELKHILNAFSNIQEAVSDFNSSNGKGIFQ